MRELIRGRRSMLEASKRDLESSKVLYRTYRECGDEYYVESSCYLIHQGIEKYLKHLLEVRYGKYPREHYLSILLRELGDNGDVLKGVIGDNLEHVVKWNVSMRYPSSYYADLKILEGAIDQLDYLVTEEMQKLKDKIKGQKKIMKTNLFKLV